MSRHYLPEWNRFKSYRPGDEVTYQDIEYKNVRGTNEGAPNQGYGDWKLITPGGQVFTNTENLSGSGTLENPLDLSDEVKDKLNNTSGGNLEQIRVYLSSRNSTAHKGLENEGGTGIDFLPDEKYNRYSARVDVFVPFLLVDIKGVKNETNVKYFLCVDRYSKSSKRRAKIDHTSSGKKKFTASRREGYKSGTTSGSIFDYDVDNNESLVFLADVRPCRFEITSMSQYYDLKLDYYFAADSKQLEDNLKDARKGFPRILGNSKGITSESIDPSITGGYTLFTKQTTKSFKLRLRIEKEYYEEGDFSTVIKKETSRPIGDLEIIGTMSAKVVEDQVQLRTSVTNNNHIKIKVL